MKLNKALLVTSAITMSLFTGVANADVIDGKETGTIHLKGNLLNQLVLSKQIMRTQVKEQYS